MSDNTPPSEMEIKFFNAHDLLDEVEALLEQRRLVIAGYAERVRTSDLQLKLLQSRVVELQGIEDRLRHELGTADSEIRRLREALERESARVQAFQAGGSERVGIPAREGPCLCGGSRCDR